ncbi:MAG: hypothetical protein CL910_07125 [Deltaproteobacteria bacterium]|nr:hypothetical protein [Deltaproteobacteria bacterium]
MAARSVVDAGSLGLGARGAPARGDGSHEAPFAAGPGGTGSRVLFWPESAPAADGVLRMTGARLVAGW